MDLSSIKTIADCKAAIQQREYVIQNGQIPSFLVQTVKDEIKQLEAHCMQLAGPVSIYDYLCQNIGYSANLQKCIKETYDNLVDPNVDDTSVPGLLLGKIQSGKTRAFVGVMAMAFDNGFDACIVLTKPDDGLVMQTKARMEQDFNHFLDDTNVYPQNVVCVYDVKKQISLTSLTANYKNIFVLHKNKRLEAMKKTLDAHYEGKRILIIDDEADFVSRTFYSRQKQVKGGVTGFRIDGLTANPLIDCFYLQVTATPYSLLLQPNEVIDVQNGVLSCFRPRFTSLVPTHDKYVGGEQYFDKSTDPNSMYSLLMHPVSDRCLDRFLKKNADRRITLQAATHSDFADLRDSLMFYFVGSAVRRIQERVKRVSYKTSFLIHCATEKDDHSYEKKIVDLILTAWRKNILQGQTVMLKNEFVKVYADLYQSNALGNTHIDPNTGKTELAVVVMPSSDDVWAEFLNIFNGGLYMVQCINGDTSDDPNLYQSDGQLKLPSYLNIFIGGYKADRGITINNMIGFLYGRRPQSGGTANTILQHMRHYGNRSVEDMAVTRLHTTQNMFQRLHDIYDTDESLRKFFVNNATPDVTYIEYDPQSAGFRLASPQQIRMSSLRGYGAFGRIIATPGFQTKPNNVIAPTISAIYKEIAKHAPEKTPFLLDKNEVYRILHQIKSTYQYSNALGNKELEWDENTMIAAIEKHVPADGQLWVYYALNREMGRKKSNNGRYEDAPEDGNTDTVAAKNHATNRPFLMLIHEKGKILKGWNDAPFYWPVLRLPMNAQPHLFCDGAANASRNNLTLTVTKADGTQVAANNTSQLLIECIKIADPSSVEALGIKYRKNNLVYSAGRKPKDYHVIVPKQYYLRKGITTIQAEEFLKDISSRLNLGWTIILK